MIVTAWLGSEANDGSDESLALLSLLLAAITHDEDAIVYFDEASMLVVEASLNAPVVH